MRDNVRAFVAAAAESFQPAGPVFEFGSFVGTQCVETTIQDRLCGGN